MPLSYTRLIADGATDVFTFALPYASDKELTVFVNGTPVSFEHLSQGTIRLVSKPQTTDTIEIHRKTSVTELAQDYTGAGISKETLRVNSTQVLHKLQELEESTLTLGPVVADMKGKRLTNIALPLEDGDAASKGWVEATLTRDQSTLLEHTKQAEAHATKASGTLNVLQTLGAQVEGFTKTTEDQTSKLLTEMAEKASLLDKIIQKERELSTNAQAYEEALLSRKQEFLEALEEEKETLTFQEQQAQDALEQLATAALEATKTAQDNKDLLVAERVKAVAEIAELMGRHKVLLETCDNKEKSLQERITQESSSLESKVTATVSLLDIKLKEILAALDQKMTEALATCQNTTADLGGTLKTQLTEKVQETLESITKARLASVTEVSELLGRIKTVAEETTKDREEIKAMKKEIKRTLRQLTDGEVDQPSQEAQQTTESPQPEPK